MTSTATATTLHTLLEGLIDYAGLFPPAGLDMPEAVQKYARYKQSEYSWMLGRFIVPASRLPQFEQGWLAAGEPSGWKLSALVSRSEELDAVQGFNARHVSKVQIDSLEMKAVSAADVKAVPGFQVYFEVPNTSDPMPLIVAMKREQVRAKIRTGGVTPDAIPDATVVTRFLRACASVGVPFKATAGLHHPVRCVRPLTYEPNSLQGIMHGFLNVFLAAGFARKGYAALFVDRVLQEKHPQAFKFNSDSVEWHEAKLSAAEIAEMRTKFAIAFGSCSFEEPIADLRAIRLLV